VSFTPSRSNTSPTAEPSTFVNSSDISLTITDTSPSTAAPSLSIVSSSTAAAAATTTVSSSSVATTTSFVVPSETVHLPTRESSEPCDYCSATSTNSSSITTDFDGSACATATVSPTFDSVELDPLAPSFVPASVIVYPSVYVSDPVVDAGLSLNDEFEVLKETQLKVPVSALDRKELELPDHVHDLFVQTVEGLDLPHDTIEGLRVLLSDHRDTFASSSSFYHVS